VDYELASSRALVTQLAMSFAHDRTMTFRDESIRIRMKPTTDVVAVKPLPKDTCFFVCAGRIVDLTVSEIKEGIPYYKLSNNLALERMLRPRFTKEGRGRASLPTVVCDVASTIRINEFPSDGKGGPSTASNAVMSLVSVPTVMHVTKLPRGSAEFIPSLVCITLTEDVPPGKELLCEPNDDIYHSGQRTKVSAARVGALLQRPQSTVSTVDPLA